MLTLPDSERSRLRQAATTALKARRFDAARSALQRLALAEPGNAGIPLDLATVAFEAGDRAACLSHLDQATAMAPDNPKLWAQAANRYAALGADEAALAAHDRRVALEPKAIAPRADRAWHLQRMGRLDEANAALRKLIRKHPGETELYRILAGTARFAKGDPLIREMERLFPRTEGKDHPRMHLGFALAKAMDDTGRTDRVFPYLDRANAAQQRLAPFDADAVRRERDALIAAQDALDPTPPDGASQTGPAPIFVCGMPRSGTTLVEQILARHSDVTAGGELGHAYRIVGAHLGGTSDPSPAAVRDAAQALADRYGVLVRRDTDAGTARVTDKAIRSERLFGFIRHALPGATFVVVHRDPRDIALSIYRNHFQLGTHRYANRLEDIAGVIKLFRATVDHWKAKLPGMIHEIRYERLVTDPETETRGLVAAAGLDWQEACLDPTAGTGTVRTLSLAQVRQPIHAGRKAAWRQFETELRPFIDAWGDDPWD